MSFYRLGIAEHYYSYVPKVAKTKHFRVYVRISTTNNGLLRHKADKKTTHAFLENIALVRLVSNRQYQSFSFEHRIGCMENVFQLSSLILKYQDICFCKRNVLFFSIYFSKHFLCFAILEIFCDNHFQICQISIITLIFMLFFLSAFVRLTSLSA